MGTLFEMAKPVADDEEIDDSHHYELDETEGLGQAEDQPTEEGGEEPIAPYWKWTRFKTQHIKHLGELDIEGCQFLVIKGKNEAGKSLTELCFKMCFDASLCSPKLIADGFDEATVELSLAMSDGSMALTITRTLTRKTKGHDVDIVYGDGSIVKNQKETFLKGLAKGFGLDPLLLIPSDVKTRGLRETFLREHLPVEFSGSEVGEIVGQKGLPAVLDLAHFEGLLAGAEQRRTEINREKDEIDGAIKQLLPSVPSKPPTEDWVKKEADLSADLAKRDKAWALRQQTIKQACIDKKSDRAKKLAADIEEQTRKLTAAAELDYAVFEQERDKSLEDEQAANDASLADLREQVGRAKEAATHQVSVQGVVNHYNDQRKKQQEIALKAATAQMVVDKMVEHRAKRFAQLPAGIEYRKGGFLSIREKDGTEKDFDTEINKARKVKIAMLLASYAKQPVHVFVVDEAEVLDSTSRRWTEEAAKDVHYQVIYAEKTEGPLTFERKGEI